MTTEPRLAGATTETDADPAALRRARRAASERDRKAALLEAGPPRFRGPPRAAPKPAELRLSLAATAIENDALFVAKAALQLAVRQQRDAVAQVDHWHKLIERLERRTALAG